MDEPRRTVNPACVRPHRAQANGGLGKPSSVQALLETLLSESQDTHCRDIAEAQMLVEANSKPRDIVIYTDGSVARGRPCWRAMVKGERTVHEDSDDHRVTTFSLTISHTYNTVASPPT